MTVKLSPNAYAESSISSEHYFTAHNGVVGAAERGAAVSVFPELKMLTFCVLVLHDGSKVVGEHHYPDAVTSEVGRIEARKNAFSKLLDIMERENEAGQL